VKRLLLLLFLPLFLAGESFVVASYNVENLFDDVKNGSEYDDYIPGRHNWTSRMVEIKLNHTAEVLCDLDADIVALQEIENEAILARLQKRLKRVGCPYPYRAITHKKKTAIQLALLSRYPIVDKRELSVSYTGRDRNILEAVVKIDGHPLRLFVNHWKAKSRSGKESRRIRYAKVLKRRIEQLPRGSEYLILGDLNAHYDEYRVLTERLDDSSGKTGINHILKTIKRGDLISEEQIVSDREGSHYNLWLELAPAKRWSHKYYGRRGSIDHILLPQTLFDGKGIDYINNSFAVFRRPYLFTREGWINGWNYSNGKHKGKGYSDHLPIYAGFSTKAYQIEKAKKATEGSIEDLYRSGQPDHPVRLKGCVVILKRGTNAIIKQKPGGRAIFIYAAAAGLEEGACYDLTASEIKVYKGMQEILRIDHPRKCDKSVSGAYYLKQKDLDIEDLRLQNQVFVSLKGVYRHNHLEIDGKKIPIYFKNKRWRPADGSRLRISYAHLGAYRKPQLIIYSRKDFKIEK